MLLASRAEAAKPAPAPQEVLGSYWTAEPGWHTEFQLRNNLISVPLVVTPVLRLANGREYPLTPVSIPPSDVVTVDVPQELEKTAPTLMEQAGTFGSVVFRFTSLQARNLYAAVMVHEMGQPIGYHIDAFGMDPGYTAGAREGICWLPHSGVNLVDMVESSSEWISYIADVSGHGVASGVLMAMFKTSIRSGLGSNVSPGELLEGVHRTLYLLKMPNMFVTAGVLQFRPGSKSVSYLLAGHPAPMRYCSQQRVIVEYASQNLPLRSTSDRRRDGGASPLTQRDQGVLPRSLF